MTDDNTFNLFRQALRKRDYENALQLVDNFEDINYKYRNKPLIFYVAEWRSNNQARFLYFCYENNYLPIFLKIYENGASIEIKYNNRYLFDVLLGFSNDDKILKILETLWNKGLYNHNFKYWENLIDKFMYLPRNLFFELFNKIRNNGKINYKMLYFLNLPKTNKSFRKELFLEDKNKYWWFLTCRDMDTDELKRKYITLNQEHLWYYKYDELIKYIELFKNKNKVIDHIIYRNSNNYQNISNFFYETGLDIPDIKDLDYYSSIRINQKKYRILEKLKEEFFLPPK